MKNVTTSLFAAGALLTAAATAQAGIIASWGSLQATSSNADIVNPGNVVHAVNFGNEVSNVAVTTTAGVIQFDPTGVFGGAGFKNDDFFVDNNTDDGSAVVTGDDNVDDSSGDTDLHRVLDSFRDNSQSGYTFTGLAPGEYQLQVWAGDDRSGNRKTQFQIVTDLGGLGEAVHADTGLLNLNDDVFRSAFIIADIEITAGDTEFTLYKSVSGGQRPINAAVLTLVPEPGSLALLALGGLMVARRRRG